MQRITGLLIHGVVVELGIVSASQPDALETVVINQVVGEVGPVAGIGSGQRPNPHAIAGGDVARERGSTVALDAEIRIVVGAIVRHR